MLKRVGVGPGVFTTKAFYIIDESGDKKADRSLSYLQIQARQIRRAEKRNLEDEEYRYGGL